ncbi:hypothetical protein Q9S71_02360 [Microbacterium sp. KSW4-11]|uniref:Uncharacterized protein n=1 Tax=Microbacterium gawkjiense TaxID=3067309 RepID=A0ABU3G761_9MICO|nr:hypothetical protein [Microbacterium sp. KSW4-11]MDT3315657.1 hypothetical protein [Microbacterium sp. KSW4-11]
MITTLIRDEARARGELGPTALSMLLRVFDTELRSFRGLAEIDTAEDLALEFFADRATSYVDAVLAAPDDEAATRLTRRWGRNWLIDRARATPYGALRHRLEKRLQRSPLFHASSVAHHWFLEGEEDTDRVASFEEIYAVAADIRVDVIVDAGGGLVLGKTGQLEEMVTAVLKLSGRLHISDLTYLCAQRFPSVLEDGDWLTARHRTAEVEDAEDTHPSDDAIFEAAEQAADSRGAQEIFDRLTAAERLALRFGDNPREVASRLGVGRSTAYSRIQSAKARLLELGGDRTRARQVMTDVLRLILDDDFAVPSIPVGGA